MAYDDIDDTDADGHSRRRPLTLSSQPNRPSHADTSANRRPIVPGGKFNDGRAVLPGFILSEAPVGQDEWYPLPDVPKGWTPDPRRVWELVSDESKEPEKPSEELAKDGWKKPPIAQEVSLPSLDHLISRKSYYLYAYSAVQH